MVFGKKVIALMESVTGLPLMLLILCFMTTELFLPSTDAELMNCLDSDREALIDFKNGLHDPEYRLSSWKGSNCCQWRGISCENNTGAVIAVDLHNPYPLDDFLPYDPHPRYVFWNLSGEIRPSLTKLKSLRNLDLSFNTFNNGPIPEFFGSLKNLKYLNLSHAGFSGAIPPNLGNLSSLQYLDVSCPHSWDIEGLFVDNPEWISGLVSLKHLVMNGVDLSMVGSDWIRRLDKLSSLTELYLSRCSLSAGSFPPLTFGNLTSLAVLDLSINTFNSKIPDCLVNVSSLVTLDISNNDLIGRIPLGFSDLPNLQFLYIRGNSGLTASCRKLLGGRWEKIQVLDFSKSNLHGKLPDSIGNMTFLAHLDLSGNNVVGVIPGSIGNLCNLMFLDLSGNNMTGTLAEFLEGADNCHSKWPLPSLQSLDLSDNNLVGKLPERLRHLENLVELDLSNNSLSGPIPASLGLLQNLVELYLSSNSLSGPIPASLGLLQNLVVLYLSNNSLSGPIPASLGLLQNLSYLGLGENELNGTLPESLGQLSELSTLDVSSNQLTGGVTEIHFLKQKKLSRLYLSSNSLTLNVSSNWVPPFQVFLLHMGSCKLGPSFPAWLQSQKEVHYLDFSNASISGSIPYWFWESFSDLWWLNVSFNQLSSQLPSPLKFHSTLVVLDFSSNHFSGSIPTPVLDYIQLLDLSKNKLTGNIPNNIIGSVRFLSIADNQINGEIPHSKGVTGCYHRVIQLSNNNLTGSIPSSIGNCSGLKILDVSNNSLSGTIPASLGQLSELEMLQLNDNQLYGELPSSFQNLSHLKMLNLGNNRLIGTIPSWIGKGFEHLRILSLRSNSFYGELPPALSNLTSLQVMDLAENQLNGSIPASFGDFKAMLQLPYLNPYHLKMHSYNRLYSDVGLGSYSESFVVTMKGQLLKYTKTLSLLNSLDLSGNNLRGDLPKEITKLLGLMVLNLSGNHITGHIPESISKLKQLQSLDLSGNRFSGAIPQSLATLSFLGYLNLSDNDFSGKIPFKDHMITFEASSFAGNLGLCGRPLSVKCPGDDDPKKGWPTLKDNSGGDTDSFFDKWFYLSIGLGFAAGILVPFLVLSIRQSWSIAYFDAVEEVLERILYMWLKYRTIWQRTRRHHQRR